MLNDILSINEQGNLTVDSVESTFLCAKYGTPLYVMSEKKIRDNCKKIKNSIDRFFGENGLVLYASKAFSCKEIYRIINSEGLGADVVSGGELFTALQAGFPCDKIYFHGNNKTSEELLMAVENDVGMVVVDNLPELEVLSSLAVSFNKQVNILLRIKPGIDAHTHDFIKTGQIDSKFGFALETGEAEYAFKIAVSKENIKLCGLHCHIGSQILETEPYVLATKVMLDFAVKMKNLYNCEISVLNLGGGFGISYDPSEKPLDIDKTMEKVSKCVCSICTKNAFKTPLICVEPGRSIVANAGLTFYTVGSVKTIPNIRTYVSVDGGMTDNPRYALYGSKYEMLIANKALLKKTDTVTVAGRCCESGDLLQENILLQQAEKNDVLAVLSTGAYNYSMASNYNRIPRAAVVMVNNGKDRVIIRGESYEDIVRNDV